MNPRNPRNPRFQFLNPPIYSPTICPNIRSSVPAWLPVLPFANSENAAHRPSAN
jgi:hypothetical protein